MCSERIRKMSHRVLDGNNYVPCMYIYKFVFKKNILLCFCSGNYKIVDRKSTVAQGVAYDNTEYL